LKRVAVGTSWEHLDSRIKDQGKMNDVNVKTLDDNKQKLQQIKSEMQDLDEKIKRRRADHKVSIFSFSWCPRCQKCPHLGSGFPVFRSSPVTAERAQVLEDKSNALQQELGEAAGAKRDESKRQEFKANLEMLKSCFPGVRGCVSDLCKVQQTGYHYPGRCVDQAHSSQDDLALMTLLQTLKRFGVARCVIRSMNSRSL